MSEKIQSKWFLLFLASILLTAPLFASAPAMNVFPEAMPQVIKNLEHTGDLLDTAQGYLAEFREDLQKIREFLVKGANGIYSEADRKEIMKGIINYLDECARILEHAQFNGMTVFYNPVSGENYRLYPVTLSPSDPTYKINISCGNFGFDVLKKFSGEILPNPSSMNDAIGKLDNLLTAVCMEAAKIGAYQSRIEYAIKFSKILKMGAANKDFYLNIAGLNKELEARLFTLAVMSANGIYIDVDRQQIQLEFNELFDELKRYENITGVKNVFGDLKNPSLLTQKASEEMMLLMADKFSKYNEIKK